MYGVTTYGTTEYGGLKITGKIVVVAKKFYTILTNIPNKIITMKGTFGNTVLQSKSVDQNVLLIK